MQIHIGQRTIWLTRHGESEYNVDNRIGGDPPLTVNGQKYAKALSKFIQSQHPPLMKEISVKQQELQEKIISSQQQYQQAHQDSDKPPLTPPLIPTNDPELTHKLKQELHIWASALLRAKQCVSYFDPEEFNIKYFRNLNEIYSGTCENLTYKEIEQMYPQVWKERHEDKLTFRYPGTGGESYVDVIERLRPVIMELERMEANVLIVTHQVVSLAQYYI